MTNKNVSNAAHDLIVGSHELSEKEQKVLEHHEAMHRLLSNIPAAKIAEDMAINQMLR